MKGRKIYVCRKLRLLAHLLQHGYEPFRTEPDVNNPRYNVWLFWEDEEGGLRSCIEDYYSKPYFVSKSN